MVVLKDGMSSIRILGVKWPTQVRPGDEVYVPAALTVRTQYCSAKIELIFGDNSLQVTGLYSPNRNTFVLPASAAETEYVIGLKYLVSQSAKCNAHIDIALAIYKRKFKILRIFLACLLGLLVILPYLKLAVDLDLLSLQITFARFLTIGIPATLLLSLVLSSKKALPIIKELFTEDIFSPVAVVGSVIGAIEVKEAFAGRSLISSYTP